MQRTCTLAKTYSSGLHSYVLPPITICRVGRAGWGAAPAAWGKRACHNAPANVGSLLCDPCHNQEACLHALMKGPGGLNPGLLKPCSILALPRFKLRQHNCPLKPHPRPVGLPIPTLKPSQCPAPGDHTAKRRKRGPHLRKVGEAGEMAGTVCMGMVGCGTD